VNTPVRPSREALSAASAQLEEKSPDEILEWAAQQYAPRLAFATGFGLEGCVIIDIAVRHRLPIDVFTLDTGLLFPETYELWRRLEEKYGITIRAVKPAQTVGEQSVTEGPALWGVDPDRCCELRKMAPLRAELEKHVAWISAIRRDQTPDRADAAVVSWDGRFGLVKVNPLVRWTMDDVRAHIAQFEVPYNPMHDHGFPSIGCWPCTTAVADGEDPRAGRWRGREKKECGLHFVSRP
jgi:phosphoadenylyl-sulfate reductase (thioredoxin)